MIYMLDTNIIIYLFKHRSQSVADKINHLTSNDKLVMSFVTYAELLKGVAGSQKSDESMKKIKKMIEIIPVILPNLDVCSHYAKWAHFLKIKGCPIGGNDLWIASHALSCNATLVTHNVRVFQRIGDLKIENWVAD